MHNLQPYKPAIIKLCKIYKVKKLYAFGSILTDGFKQDSNVDLIVEFKSIEVENYADNYFDFKFSLQDVLKKSVDLLEEQAIKNPYLKKIIDEKKQLVYEEHYQPRLFKEQIQRIEESKQQIKQGHFLQMNKLISWLKIGLPSTNFYPIKTASTLFNFLRPGIF